MNVGAGTVCSLTDLERAQRAGAGFVVCPVLDTDLVAEAKKRGLPVFPGALTPTEVFSAWNAARRESSGTTVNAEQQAAMLKLLAGERHVTELRACSVPRDWNGT